MAVWQGIGEAARRGDLSRRLMFVLGALLVYRIGTHIPVPGINPEVMRILFEQQRGTILDMFNMFSGGALQRFSIFSLGVMPYITASIIMQLMSQAIPQLEQLRKEGGLAGQRKIMQWTRYATVGLAAFQAVGVAVALQGQGGVQGQPLVIAPGIGFVFTATVSLVTGTMFLMWLGEQMTEHGLGNGISLIIFVGIVAGLPGAIGSTLELARTGELHALMVLFLLALALAVTGFVVFVEKAQRRITVNYARRQQGRMQYAVPSSHLPLKLNPSGVLPPIFASSIILFPATLGKWMGDVPGLAWMGDLATLVSPGTPLYVFLYALAIVFFSFFAAALMFNARETAQGLKRTGAFVPGIRPGDQTARYLDGVLTRLVTAGALYLTAVCLLPEFMILYLNVPFYFGGTSLLIIVVVVMDFWAQVQAHLVSHQYESLLKKHNLKGFGPSGVVR